MHIVFECGREFGLDIFVTDTDLCLINECVALATEHAELSACWGDAITYTRMMMNQEQRERFAIERLYPEAIEAAIFGRSEVDAIVVEDGDEEQDLERSGIFDR